MPNNNYPVYDVTLQSSASSNGNGTPWAVGGLAGVSLQVQGLGTATVNFEATVDGSNWYAAAAVNVATQAVATSTAANGLFVLPVAGYDQLRARISGWASGAVTVTGKGLTSDSAAVLLASPSLSVTQGTAAAASGYWPVRGTDGTNLSPAMDAAARKGWVAVTDGTNALPTMDSAARAGFVKLTDGTNTVSLSGTNVPVAPVGATANGLSQFKARDLGSTVTSIKAGAGTLYGLQILNNQGAAAYVQIFNVAAGSVTLGTTNPDKEVLVAASSFLNVPLPALGVAFGTAISVASTTAEKGSTGSAAGVQVFADYA